MIYLVLTPETKAIVCKDYADFYRLSPVTVGDYECLPIDVLNNDAYLEARDVLSGLQQIEEEL